MKKALTRIHRYLHEMFPLPRHVAVAALTYLSVALFAARVYEEPVDLLSWYTLIGIWSVFDLWLILRLMDELKDEDIDRELFPERPLPSGRVLRSDIHWCLAITMTAYIAVMLPVRMAFWTGLIVLGYASLMFRRFFAPNLLRRSLILTLMTHNPIVPLMLLQAFVISAAQSKIPVTELRFKPICVFVLMLWSPFLTWELARKIRSREEETAYVTYSQIFGAAGAVAVTAGVGLLGVSAALFLWIALGLSWMFPTLVALGFTVSVSGYVRFLLRPSPQTSKLKNFAAVSLLSTLAAPIVEFAWLD